MLLDQRLSGRAPGAAEHARMDRAVCLTPGAHVMVDIPGRLGLGREASRWHRASHQGKSPPSLRGAHVPLGNSDFIVKAQGGCRLRHEVLPPCLFPGTTIRPLPPASLPLMCLEILSAVYMCLLTFLKTNLFECWVSVAALGLSLVAVSRGLLCCGKWGSHCGGFSHLRVQALEPQLRSWRTACGIVPTQGSNPCPELQG